MKCLWGYLCSDEKVGLYKCYLLLKLAGKKNNQILKEVKIHEGLRVRAALPLSSISHTPPYTQAAVLCRKRGNSSLCLRAI